MMFFCFKLAGLGRGSSIVGQVLKFFLFENQLKKLHDKSIDHLMELESPMNLSRRKLFLGAVGILSFGLMSSLVSAEERRRARGADKKAAAGGPLADPLVDPKDPTAQAMNYAEKHADVKKAELKIERSGVAFEKQNCSNCGFFKEVGTKDKAKVGTCTLFSRKLVKNEAWCSSWNKKA